MANVMGIPVEDISDAEFKELDKIPDEDFNFDSILEDDLEKVIDPDLTSVEELKKSEDNKKSDGETDDNKDTSDDEIPENLQAYIESNFYKREDIDSGDPIADKNHPLHDMAVKASQSGRELSGKLKSTERQLAELQKEIDSGVASFENDPSKGIYGGISWDDVDNRDVEAHEYFEARDKYNNRNLVKAQQEKDATLAWQVQVDNAKGSGYTEEQIQEVLETYNSESGKDFSLDDGLVVLEINKVGGLAEFKKVLLNQGIEQGRKEAITKISSNVNNHDKNFSSSEGLTRDPSADNSNFDINADINKMSEVELDAHIATWQSEYDKGNVEYNPRQLFR